MFCDHVLAHPNLDTKNHVGILSDRSSSRLGLGVVDVVELGDRETSEAGHCNMDECKLPGSRRGHDKSAIGSKIVGSSITRRDDSRRGLVSDQFVRGNTDRRSVRKRMAMQVNQPGRDQLASRVKYPCGTAGVNGAVNRTNLTVTDSNITLARKSLTGVQHIGITNEKIKLFSGIRRPQDSGRHGAKRKQ